MQKPMFFALLAVLLVGAMTVGYANVAYAEKDITDSELEKVAGDAISSTLAIAGTGMASGAFLSIVRIIGKNVQQSKPEGFALNKFLVTVGVGGAVGFVLGMLGVNQEAALGIDVMVVFLLSQTLFPVMKNRKWKAK